MHRSYDYHPNHHYGWDTTSQEYVENVSRTERKPTMVTGLSRFPNLYKFCDGHARDKKAICQEQHENLLSRLNHQENKSQKYHEQVSRGGSIPPTAAVTNDVLDQHCRPNSNPSALNQKVIFNKEGEFNNNYHPHMPPADYKKSEQHFEIRLEGFVRPRHHYMRKISNA